MKHACAYFMSTTTKAIEGIVYLILGMWLFATTRDKFSLRLQVEGVAIKYANISMYGPTL